jgi:hypothetical protein
MAETAAAAHALNAQAATASVRTQSRPFDNLLRTLRASGGDERIWPDPESGRNRYGTPVTPVTDAIWFSSFTATAISGSAFDAAHGALCTILDSEHATRKPIDAWFHDLRTQILALSGCQGTAAVLTPPAPTGN